MECRSSDIKIHPPIGKNFQEDEDTVDHMLDSFCRSPDKSIRRNDIPFCSNTSPYSYNTMREDDANVKFSCKEHAGSNDVR
ncbi:UNVERIFIED_CONTAM: hypothetical protein NCL1_22071 [Trichonephila clavipes]